MGARHAAGVGKAPGAAWAAAAGQQEPKSGCRERATAPAHLTGACPLGQGRGKAPTGGPGLQCPGLNPFKPCLNLIF
jgi:hypothetical protein